MTVSATDPPILPPLGRWALDAACADRYLLDVFYPPEHHGIAQAKEICGKCLVREECLAYALANKVDFGVWGGLSARGRRQLLKEQRTPAPPPPPRPILEGIRHGTLFGYKKGCRCVSCLERKRAKDADWYRRQRAPLGVVA